MKKVAVIILHYKNKTDTLKCLSSVLTSTYRDMKIILVNNSEEELIDEIKDKNIEYIKTDKNLGYTGGNNIGIKKALAIGVDYVFILNPDTTVDKKTIEILIRESEGNGAGVAAPKIYFTGSKKIWHAGGTFDFGNVLGSHIGVDEKEAGRYDNLKEVDFVTGAAMIIKRDVLEKVGLFDERYFLYYEDSDFCYRAKRQGFKVIYVPQAIVYHDNAKSTGLGSPLQDYFITRNRLLFASKFLSLRTQFALFREAIRNLGNPIRRRAFTDFLLGNFGKGSYKDA